MVGELEGGCIVFLSRSTTKRMERVRKSALDEAGVWLPLKVGFLPFLFIPKKGL